jgi:hypothetical protein
LRCGIALECHWVANNQNREYAMTLMWVIARLAVVLSIVSAPLASRADVWHFQGNCNDCAEAAGVDAWLVQADLEVRDYAGGSQLSRDNFQSFHYYGSNLVEDFFIDEGTWDGSESQFLSGVLPAGPGGPTAFPFHMQLTSNDEVLWTCTDLGAAVARSPVCSITDRIFFHLSGSGVWIFGAPPMDIGEDGAMEFVGPAPNAVPEPNTLALLGLGIVGLGLARRGKLHS